MRGIIAHFDGAVNRETLNGAYSFHLVNEVALFIQFFFVHSLALGQVRAELSVVIHLGLVLSIGFCIKQKTISLIYQCFDWLFLQKWHFGSLVLRLSDNSDKLHFNASFILFVT